MYAPIWGPEYETWSNRLTNLTEIFLGLSRQIMRQHFKQTKKTSLYIISNSFANTLFAAIKPMQYHYTIPKPAVVRL
jgi:hypothetical protein